MRFGCWLWLRMRHRAAESFRWPTFSSFLDSSISASTLFWYPNSFDLLWCLPLQVYLKDTGSSSGTFLNHLRLSPSGRESRPYPLKEGDIIQLGIDYQGRPEEIYKCVVIRVGMRRWGVVERKRRANVAMWVMRGLFEVVVDLVICFTWFSVVAPVVKLYLRRPG